MATPGSDAGAIDVVNAAAVTVVNAAAIGVANAEAVAVVHPGPIALRPGPRATATSWFRAHSPLPR